MVGDAPIVDVVCFISVVDKSLPSVQHDMATTPVLPSVHTEPIIARRYAAPQPRYAAVLVVHIRGIAFPSVCLFVCSVQAPNSEKRCRKIEIGVRFQGCSNGMPILRPKVRVRIRVCAAFGGRIVPK